MHHKTHLTPDNIDDPSVALNFDNLELLCREHHMQEHNDEINSSRKRQRDDQRYWIDDYGTVHIKEFFSE